MIKLNEGVIFLLIPNIYIFKAFYVFPNVSLFRQDCGPYDQFD